MMHDAYSSIILKYQSISYQCVNHFHCEGTKHDASSSSIPQPPTMECDPDTPHENYTWCEANNGQGCMKCSAGMRWSHRFKTEPGLRERSSSVCGNVMSWIFGFMGSLCCTDAHASSAGTVTAVIEQPGESAKASPKVLKRMVDEPDETPPAKRVASQGASSSSDAAVMRSFDEFMDTLPKEHELVRRVMLH